MNESKTLDDFFQGIEILEEEFFAPLANQEEKPNVVAPAEKKVEIIEPVIQKSEQKQEKNKGESDYIPEPKKKESQKVEDPLPVVNEEDVDSEPLIDYTQMFRMMCERSGLEYNDEINISSEDELEEALGEMFNMLKEPAYKTDIAKDLDSFVENGGNPLDFLRSLDSIDYSAIEIETVEEAKALLYDYYKKTKNLKDREITALIKNIEEDGSLEEATEACWNELINIQAEERKSLLREQEDFKKQQEAQYYNYWNAVKSKIDSANKIAGFEITEKEKEKFFNYVYEKDKSGLTAYEKYMQNPDNSLAIAFLAFRDMKKDVAIKEARTEVTRSWNNLFLRRNNSSEGQYTPSLKGNKAKSVGDIFD